MLRLMILLIFSCSTVLHRQLNVARYPEIFWMILLASTLMVQSFARYDVYFDSGPIFLWDRSSKKAFD